VLGLVLGFKMSMAFLCPFIVNLGFWLHIAASFVAVLAPCFMIYHIAISMCMGDTKLCSTKLPVINWSYQQTNTVRPVLFTILLVAFYRHYTGHPVLSVHLQLRSGGFCFLTCMPLMMASCTFGLQEVAIFS